MTNRDTPQWLRALIVSALGIGGLLAWIAVKWVVRIYLIVWLERLGVPPGISWIIAFGTVTAFILAAAYFLKPTLTRLMNGEKSQDI